MASDGALSPGCQCYLGSVEHILMDGLVTDQERGAMVDQICPCDIAQGSGVVKLSWVVVERDGLGLERASLESPGEKMIYSVGGL